MSSAQLSAAASGSHHRYAASRCRGCNAAAAAAAIYAAPPQQRRRRAALVVRRAFTLEPVDGSGSGSGIGQTKALAFDRPRVVLGSSPAADVRLPDGDGIAPEHAALTQRGRSVFLTALSGESVFDPSRAFIDGAELRPNVAYVLSSGSVLAFGRNCSDGGGGGGGAISGGGGGGCSRFVVRFDEPKGGGPLEAVLLAGATAGASADVRAAMQDAAKAD